MNCWEILNISCTGDVKKIKKAYAQMATLHHPETDPEGFQIVNRAFKQALSYASKLNAENNDELVPPTHCKTKPAELTFRKGQMDEYTMPDDFPINLLHQNEAKTTAEKAVEESPPSENNFSFHFEVSNENLSRSDSANVELVQYNFDLHMEKGFRNKQQQMFPTLLKARGIYENPHCRNRKRCWTEFFQSDVFCSLQRDALFTHRFLEYAMTFERIRPWVWNDVFVPILEDWSMLWTWSEFQVTFQEVKAKRYYPVELMIKYFLRNFRKPKFLLRFAIFIFIILEFI
jgi:hypothetical protein